MKYPVVKHEGLLYLVLMIEGDSNVVCINKDGDLDFLGMASLRLTMEEALKREGFDILDHQTLREFLEC